MDRTRAIPESAPLIRVNSSGEAERGVAKAGPVAAKVLVSVLVLQVAIDVASVASLRIWTLEASPGEPIASRPSEWQTAPMPLAPVGTERVNRTPAARYFHALAYDSHADRVILFGGFLGYWFNDTWAYDFNTNAWTDMAPGLSPPATLCDAMAYDSESDRVILFGGYVSGVGVSNDTWAYDFNTNTWTDMNPLVKPPGRYYHATAYDSASDRVILFGGYDSGSNFNDTWAYDFNTNAWTSLDHPAPSPARQRLTTASGTCPDRLVRLAAAAPAGPPITCWHADRIDA